MIYRLRDIDRWRFEMRARWSALSEERIDENHLRLYNKNAGETLHVRIVEQEPNAAIWNVECDAVPPYFQHVLTPLESVA